MRFMMLMIPRVYQGEEGRMARADFSPDAAAVERMMKYNEELANAGVLIALDGLHPPVEGALVSFPDGRPIVTEGSFVESRETVGGYWIIRVKSREEAIEWARRVPADEGDVIEVRRIFEMSDFPEDVRRAADSPTVEAEIEKRKRSA